MTSIVAVGEGDNGVGLDSTVEERIDKGLEVTLGGKPGNVVGLEAGVAVGALSTDCSCAAVSDQGSVISMPINRLATTTTSTVMRLDRFMEPFFGTRRDPEWDLHQDLSIGGQCVERDRLGAEWRMPESAVIESIPRSRITRAGDPTARQLAGMFFVTTEFAPITAPRPTRITRAQGFRSAHQKTFRLRPSRPERNLIYPQRDRPPHRPQGVGRARQ